MAQIKKIPASRTESRKKGSVLVADDTEANRILLKEILETKGFSVLAASSGTEACEIYAARWTEITAVVLDMQMEHPFAGAEAFRRMLRVNNKLNAYLLTGCADPDTVAYMKRRGLRKVWRKPPDFQEIVKTLNEQDEQMPLPRAC